jgi:hypothetical protein
MYSLYEDGEYSPEVPRATAPGIYEVWYYAKSDSIYFSDSERKCVESFIVLESDINMDGKFNSRDAVALKSYLLLGRTSRLDMAEADVNKDGGINVVDYRMVMRMLITMRGI